MRRGSALIMALWTIAVLSVMVISFAYEARQQTGINIYVQRRMRAVHLIDAAKILAEIVLLDYKNVQDWSEDQDEKELLENDAWWKEKQELKMYGKCKIGPVCIDDENPEDSIVMIEVETSNSGKQGIININELYDAASGGDVNERWWMIFRSHGIPEELDTPQEGKINLWNMLIASWKDWRDEDDVVTSIDLEECGAESDWYAELEEKFKDIDEDKKNELRRRPRNGPIPDVKELSYVRGFRDYPQVLTGGVINPWEDEKEQITVRGIIDLFCTDGSTKVNVNNCDNIDALISIPGIFDKKEIDRDEVADEAKEVAQAIIAALRTMPEDRDVDESLTSWPFKDWSEMISRIENTSGSSIGASDIGSEAKEYLIFSPDEQTIFTLKIAVESGGMRRYAEAQCYVKDNDVRYVKWTENPSTNN